MPHIITISPNAVFESFDDEVIIINMISGSYFALDAVALRIWEIMQQPQTLASVVESTQRFYSGDATEIEATVREFVGQLENEGLLILAESQIPENQPVAVAAVDENTELPIFRKPEISKFTDMEDLLLLDPIHEVDEAGWPNAKSLGAKDGA